MNQLDEGTAQKAPRPDSADRTHAAGVRQSLTAAVRFLTRIPLAGGSPAPEPLARAPVYFPLVGGLLGLFTTLLVAAGSAIWPAWLAVILALAAEMWLTGALHEDAVADVCDAFGGGWTRDQVLAILDDSRIGTFGALGLLAAVSLRAAATVALVVHYGPSNPWMWGSAIVASCMVGRWILVLAMVCAPPVRERESLAAGFGRGLTGRDLLLAGLVGAPFAIPFACLLPVQSLVAVVLLAPLAWWFLRFVVRKLGGITGDCVGCLGYVSQVVVLLAAAIDLD